MSAFTPAQQEAIAARGNVLVVAGAGTGKTRTLIERCLRLLREGASLEQMLIVTFTNAAAAEMRARLRKALEDELKAAAGASEPFPLTPALSLREREKVSPSSAHSDAPGFSPSLPASLPLPEGEGRGEGEGHIQQPPAANTAARAGGCKPPAQADWFAEQIALLDTAQISTLHSFCLSLLREHFHALAIDPLVVVLDERQTRPLARECLTDVLAEHYADRHPHSAAIQQLIRRGGRGSDEHLRALVWKLHCHAQSLPDPDAWFADQLAGFRKETPSHWHARLVTGLDAWREEWLAALDTAPEVPALTRSKSALSVVTNARAGDLQSPSVAFAADGAAAASGRHAAQAFAVALVEILAADGDWPRGTKTKLRPPFAKLFEQAEFWLSLTGADGSAAALAEDWSWSRHEMAALLELTRQFTARFTEAKRQLGGVDFADVEQLSLRLLNDEHSGAARRCRERFAHVFVDEYQDINAAQDAILCAVSRAGVEANRFLVGDIKQSIYRFRLADPRIFAGYAEAWRTCGSRREEAPSNAEAGTRNAESSQSLLTSAATSVVALSDNFRSHEAVLNFVNALFRPLMRASVGGVTYDAEAELRFGNAQARTQLAAGSDPAPRVELHVITSDEAADSVEANDAESDVEELLAIEREARFVASRLRDLRDARHAVWDEVAHEFRPVQWRDMVVLMRSPGSRGEAFAKEFHRAGVPLHAERGGFYESLEVTDLLNLLRLLDNPLQDLPLLAVLRSPLVGMSLEELVAVRAADEHGLIWDALAKFRAAGEPRHELQSLAAREGGAAPAAQAALLPHPSPLPPGEGAGTNALRPQNPLGSEAASCAPTLATILPLPAGEGRGEGEASELSSANLSLGGLRQTAFRKAKEFLTRFAEWRQLIRLGSLTQCLERVLTETHYEALLLAEPRGAERVANVRRLLDLARQFDPLQRQGLHRFLRFIEAQEEAALDHDPAPLPTEDAVRLMSIHQSKGLEFPVVVLAGLGVRFNLRDLSGDILLDAEMGLCPMVSPPQSQRRFPSLPHWLAKQRGQRELIGEELRLLYVALTRARDTLLLCGTDAGKDVAEKWRGPAAAINDLALLKARRPLDWLRLWLPTVAGEADWRSDAAGRNGLLGWNFYTADEMAPIPCRRLAVAADGVRENEPVASTRPATRRLQAAGTGAGEGEEAVVDSSLCADESEVELVAKLRVRLSQSYPHELATHEPAKTSVSVLRRRAEAEEAEATQLFHPRELPRARQRRTGQLTATQIGVAHHTFLQCVELSATGTLAELMAEAEQLQTRGVLSEREAAALSLDDLLRFWNSEAGQLVRRHAREAQREVPFTARFTIRELAEMRSAECEVRNEEGEFVIVQGVVDLAVFRPEEIWLLDYKTDHFDLAELPAKVREHGAQLRLYAHALERIYKKRVTRTWLHFLALGRTEQL